MSATQEAWLRTYDEDSAAVPRFGPRHDPLYNDLDLAPTIGLYSHTFPIHRHDDIKANARAQFIPMCWLVERDRFDTRLPWFVAECHHCRIAMGSQILHHGIGTTIVTDDDWAWPVGTKIPESLALQTACERYDDVVMLKALPAIFAKAAERFTPGGR